MSHQEQLSINKYDLLFESRLSKVEATMDNLDKNINRIDIHMREGFKDVKSEIRWMFGLMITSLTGIFAFMAHGFHWY